MDKLFKRKIQRLYEIAPLAAALYWLVVKSMTAFHTTVDIWLYLNLNFPHRAFFKRKEKRARFIGSSIQRPHRLAAALLLGVLVGGMVAAPNVESAMMWNIVWGSIFSIIVTYKSVKRWLVIMEYIGPNRKKAI